MGRVLAWPLMFLVRVYQYTISPLLPGACRYTPTCSEYGLTALRRFGAFRGGWLTLRTRADEDAVVVEVADTGDGIRKEDIKRIYDPFFTTKGIGRGTGLGLSVSYGILQEHGGAIFVDSAPGQGTTFQVALPPLRVAEAATR